MTTQKAHTELLARRRQAISNKYPSVFDGVVKLTAYDEKTGVYTSLSGCLWEFKGNALAPVYGADFMAEDKSEQGGGDNG